MPLVKDKTDYNSLSHTEFAIQATEQIFYGNYHCFPQWKNLLDKDNCPQFSIKIKEAIKHYKHQAKRNLFEKIQEDNALVFLGLVESMDSNPDIHKVIFPL